MGAGLRVWFLRDFVESLERRERAVRTRLVLRLPERLRSALEATEQSTQDPAALVPLDVGEELLMAIDAILGDGSGRVLEETAAELAARALLRNAAGVVPGDLAATLARQRTLLERPFTGVDSRFELVKTEYGFTLGLGILGRPRSTRILRCFATGVIKAAHRLVRESKQDIPTVLGELVYDRAELSVHLRPPSSRPVVVAPETAVSRRPPPRAQRAPSLAEEVDRIMITAGRASGRISQESPALSRKASSARPAAEGEPLSRTAGGRRPSR